MRYRKRLKVFPGVTLNLSKSGISTTVGTRGVGLTLGKKGTYLNAGIPGSGLYTRQRLDVKKKQPPKSQNEGKQHHQPEPLYRFPGTELKSLDDVKETTSEGLSSLYTALYECHKERKAVEQEIEIAEKQLQQSKYLLTAASFLLVGLIIPWFRKNRNTKQQHLQSLLEELDMCFVPIDLNANEAVKKAYQDLVNAHHHVSASIKIWDLTSESTIDQAATRSSASKSVSRTEVLFGFKNLEIILSSYEALHLENANGGDLFIYPGFLVILDENGNFGIIDLREVDITFKAQRFVERGEVASDAKVVDSTWYKVNKDGSPDKRYKQNFEMPICLYGELEFRSKTGLHEAYMISDCDAAQQFALSFKEYQKMLV
jgi:hypothetical protein